MMECRLPYCHVEVDPWRDTCEDCWEDRKGQLASLPDLYVMTYAMLTPGSRQLDLNLINVRGIDPAAPISLVAYDALAHSYARLAGWAQWAARLAGLPRLNLTAYTTGRGFATVVRTLQAHDTRFAAATYAGDYVMDVWAAYRRMVIQCVAQEPRHLSVACPECEATSVVTRHADEYAMCLTCGTQWPHSQLSRLRAQRSRS